MGSRDRGVTGAQLRRSGAQTDGVRSKEGRGGAGRRGTLSTGYRQSLGREEIHNIV